jgi:hypothetical protein
MHLNYLKTVNYRAILNIKNGQITNRRTAIPDTSLGRADHGASSVSIISISTCLSPYPGPAIDANYTPK